MCQILLSGQNFKQQCKGSIWGSCGNVASVMKALFISYSCISYFGHTCPKLKLDIISRLTKITNNCATQD